MGAGQGQGFLQRRLVITVAVLLLAIATGTVVGYKSALTREAILDGVIVSGVSLGGLNAAAAKSTLKARLGYLLRKPVSIQWNQNQVLLEPWQAGVSLDIEGAVAEAVAVGKTGGFWLQAMERWRLSKAKYHVQLQAEGSPFLDEAIEGIVGSVEKAPLNALLQATADGQVTVVPSQDGLKVDSAKLKEAVLAAVAGDNRQVQLPVEIAEPEVTTAQAKAWGIRQVMVSFSTQFNPEEKNRSHNIALAAAALNGTVLAPGETFSFNDRVGPRTDSSGYKDAPVIVDGALIPDLGGGVCQVSSTLYNAVLLANLGVKTRVPHTLPPNYVDLGRDATVAYDYIDFSFINTLQNHIYIVAEVEGNYIKVTFLGASQAPPFKLVSKIEETLLPQREEIEDPALPAGANVVERQGVNGFVVTLWRMINEDGSTQEEMVGKTTYKARPTVVRVGTGPAVKR